MLHRITQVEPRPGYRVWVRFHDGLAGEVDLSDLVGKGVFAAWETPGAFEQVYVDSGSGTIAWPGGIDLAPDALHADIRAAQPAR